jgi:hypothetical protein
LLTCVLVRLQTTKDVRKDLVVDAPAVLLLRIRLFVLSMRCFFFLGYPRVPSAVPKAHATPGASTYGEEKVVYNVRRYIIGLVIFSFVSSIKSDHLCS